MTQESKPYTHTPWQRKPSLNILGGPSEIARLLGVKGPAVVTNWRSRSAHFPSARTGGAQPRFDVVEVIEWLRDYGPRGSQAPAIESDRWWERMVEAFATQASVASPRSTVIALLVLRAVTLEQESPADVASWNSVLALADPLLDDDTRAERLAAVARAVEAGDPRRAGLLVEQLSVDPGTAAYIGDLIDALRPLADRPSTALLSPVLALDRDARPKAQRRSHDQLASLMAALAEVPQGGSVLDPAAGEGSVLFACGTSTTPAPRLIGREFDREAWTVARSRLLIAGLDADLGEAPFDSIRGELPLSIGSRVDAVLVDPPVSDDAPSLERWIDEGLRCLEPLGTLVIALPLSELVIVKAARRKPARRLVDAVTSLSNEGRIDGVVAVGRGVRSDVVGPVCVLRVRPQPSEQRTVPIAWVDGDGHSGSIAPMSLAELTSRIMASSRRTVPEMTAQGGGLGGFAGATLFDRLQQVSDSLEQPKHRAGRDQPHDSDSLDVLAARMGVRISMAKRKITTDMVSTQRAERPGSVEPTGASSRERSLTEAAGQLLRAIDGIQSTDPTVAARIGDFAGDEIARLRRLLG